ncbi:MAG: hypothetical protein GXY83_30250 [Rhodopirellula sp.]|nr:hypothetical protein [Rhodopirellula sp.]
MSRSFGLLLAVVVAGLLLSRARAETPWPDPVANHMVPYLTGGLTHGPMLGRPTDRCLRVWIRTAEPTPFRVVWSKQMPLSESADGYTGKLLYAEAVSTLDADYWQEKAPS